ARISPPVSLTADSPLVRRGLRGIVGRGIPDAPPGVICPASLSYRRGGACPSRRVCAVPFDLGGFRRLWAASGFLSDQKATKESPGDGSGEHRVVLLVAC